MGGRKNVSISFSSNLFAIAYLELPGTLHAVEIILVLFVHVDEGTNFKSVHILRVPNFFRNKRTVAEHIHMLSSSTSNSKLVANLLNATTHFLYLLKLRSLVASHSARMNTYPTPRNSIFEQTTCVIFWNDCRWRAKNTLHYYRGFLRTTGETEPHSFGRCSSLYGT